MPKKKAPRLAQGVDFGNIQPFPYCCSAKLWRSLGLKQQTTGAEARSNLTTKSYVPTRINGLSQGSYNTLMKMHSGLRKWPERIWYSFLIQQMCDKAGMGRGGGDHWRTRLFVIADNVSGNRRHQRGSGFAEFCKSVPGLKVTSTGDYQGAHNTPCCGYMILVADEEKVKKYLSISQRMVNTRLKKYHNDPTRKRLNANTAARENTTPTRYW